MDLYDDEVGGYLMVCRIFRHGRRWPRGPSGRVFWPQSEVIWKSLAFPWKMPNLSFELESTFKKYSTSSTRHEGMNSHKMGNFKGSGKLAWNIFKATTIQVYCLGLSSLSHSLHCTFPSLLLWSWWAWNFFWLCVAWSKFCCHSVDFQTICCWSAVNHC